MSFICTGMRILVMLLLDTLPMLGNVLLLCFFVFFIFGIIGVQLWAGLLRQRCFLQLPTNLSIPQDLWVHFIVYLKVRRLSKNLKIMTFLDNIFKPSLFHEECLGNTRTGQAVAFSKQPLDCPILTHYPIISLNLDSPPSSSSTTTGSLDLINIS